MPARRPILSPLRLRSQRIAIFNLLLALIFLPLLTPYARLLEFERLRSRNIETIETARCISMRCAISRRSAAI